METNELQQEIKKELLQLGNTLLQATESEVQTLTILRFINSFIAQPEKQAKIKALIKKIQENPKMGKTEMLATFISFA